MSRRSSSNTFIQLEGWQNHAPYLWSNKWHGTDYDMHTDTKWNFSTFGGCAYSEKRSTPIFLANGNFPLTINSSTQMPLYDGATSWQPWMNTSLLQT
jgi:hypothetical protein